MQRIAIYGAGGFARELAWLLDACNAAEPVYDFVGFIDDAPHELNATLNGSPIMTLDAAAERFPGAQFIVGVGSPATRQLLVERATASGFVPGTVIHPTVEQFARTAIGEGTVICAGNILTVDISVGRHVQVNLGCTIGHNAILDDYATLAPGVHVSGWVHLAPLTYIGTGAVIINGTADRPLEIGPGAVVGAGACVTKSVPAGVTVVGVPARPLER